MIELFTSIDFYRLPIWLTWGGGVVPCLFIMGFCAFLLFYLRLTWYIIIPLAFIVLTANWFLGLISIFIGWVSFVVIAFMVLIFEHSWFRQEDEAKPDDIIGK